MSWFADLFSALLSSGGVPVYQRTRIDFEGAGVTVADDPAKQRTVITVPGTATSGGLPSPLSLGAQTPAQFQEQPYPTTTVSDATTATLATIALPAGKRTDLRVYATGTIFMAANAFLYTVALSSWTFYRIGSGAPTTYAASYETEVTQTPPPFSATPGNPGSFTGALSGNNLVLQAVGFTAPSSWAASTVYAVGNYVKNGGNVYICVAVTGDAHSAASGGPSGTGTGIIDNHVTWDWWAAGTATPVAWGLPEVRVLTP